MIRSVEVTEYDDHDVRTLWLAARTAAIDMASGALADVVHRFPGADRFAGMETAAPITGAASDQKQTHEGGHDEPMHRL